MTARALVPRRSRRPRRSTVALLVAVVLLAVGTYVAYFSPLLVVREVVVAGQRLTTADEVITAAAVPMGEPLARQDVAAIAERTVQIPAVREATVTRRWPGTLLVTVSERQGVLAVRRAGGFVLVDGSGVAFGEVPTAPQGAVQTDVDPQDWSLLREVGVVAAALPAELVREVRLVSAAGPDRITLRLASGLTVNWGSSADSPLKAQLVAALLKQQPARTIDVSSPNTPAVK